VVFARGTGEPPGAGRVGEAFADSLRSLVNGNDAAVVIQNMAASCAQSKLVLGGYSQGAAVVDILAATGRAILGFTSPLPETVADHVAAVAVFGNPSNRIGDPLTAQPAIRKQSDRFVQWRRPGVLRRQRHSCPQSLRGSWDDLSGQRNSSQAVSRVLPLRN
jgi:hypothetical protein